MKVSIIGAGKIGSALEKVLSSAGHDIKAWDNDPAKNTSGETLEKIMPGADFLFLGVPSWAVREAAVSVQPHLDQKILVISLAKGLEENTLKTMDAVLAETLPRDQIFFILGGPLLSANISAGGWGVGVAASKNKDAFKTLADLFASTNIVLEYSPAPEAVAWAGVMKNIYTALMGVAGGLGWSENALGWLAAAAQKEMIAISEIVSRTSAEVMGTAGLGDFIASSYSQSSSNRASGEDIIKNGTLPARKNEGLNSAPLVAKLLGEKVNDFKLLKALNDIIASPPNAQNILETIIKSR